ncbi:hypothetical protein RB596_009256 [Gaeumannomyces avenae]
MDEPIAVIGLDARFPGDGDTAERFYEFLLAGRSARTDIPEDRYNADSFWHPSSERSGNVRAKAAHFLKGSISAFDAPFFSITPAEASAMDPQQRGMLEAVYKALENAGIPLEQVAGTQTGVYVGCMYSDYDRMALKDLDIPSKYSALGSVASMLSNRVSWCFNLRGPSMTIDTACSSSLVALHQACNSLKLREASMAVVGGCNLIISPEFSQLLDGAGVLGPDGVSYSFDSRGNGYSRGEGFGVVILKRVSDAIRDGDVIRAVIRNTGSNQDGRSPVITAPSKAAQVDLIRRVYAGAGLDPSATRFFEAHGTGTAVGDPIEAGAIGQVFSSYRSPDAPLYVGALKSNVGHLEGAAGVAAVIKGVLTLERGVIPANTWFEKRNPKILDEWNLEFPTAPVAWPQRGLRRMSINSFGVGGSNAHVVMDDALNFLAQHYMSGCHRTIASPVAPAAAAPTVVVSRPPQRGLAALRGDEEDAGSATSAGSVSARSDSGIDLTDNESSGSKSPAGSRSPLLAAVDAPVTATATATAHVTAAEPQDGSSQEPLLFVFSAYDQEGVARVQGQIRDYIGSAPKRSLRSPTARSSRSRTSSWSSTSSKSNRDELVADLSYTLACRRTRHGWRACTTAKSRRELVTSLQAKPIVTRAATDPRLAFVFTGQGAQWPSMGRRLIWTYPAFRESLYAADEYLNSLGCVWSLTYELCKNKESSRIDDAELSQPICTAVQMALVDLLRTWKVRPHAVVGHSSGEIAAAYAAGQLSRKSAWRIAYYRGKLSKGLIRAEMLASTGGSLDERQSKPKTGMAAVGLDKDKTMAAIKRVDAMMDHGTLEIACLNSQDSVTVSGDVGKLDALVEMLKNDKVFARRLNVEIAYHSRHMKPIVDDYRRYMGDISSDLPAPAQEGQTPVYFSSLEGGLIPTSRLQSPDYWVDNLVSPVRFHEAVTQLLQSDLNTGSLGHGKEQITDLLEIGPHSALRGPLRSIIQQARGAAASKVGYETILKRNESAVDTSLGAAGTLFCRGFPVDLAAVNRQRPAAAAAAGRLDGADGDPVKMLTDLPSYPFNHTKEYWLESRLSRNHRLRHAPRHELLGAPVPGWNRHGNAVWRNYIRRSENTWVEDHRVGADVLYPAAGMLVMAIEASRQVAALEAAENGARPAVSGFRFSQVSFHTALLVPDTELGVESHFFLRPSREAGRDGWSEFQLWTSEGDDWREHCRGFVRTEYGKDALTPADGQAVLEEAKHCTSKVKSARLYRAFGDIGLGFGPTFQTLRDVKLSGNRVLAQADALVSKIRRAAPLQYLQPHMVHPSTLDAVIQAGLVPLLDLGAASSGRGVKDSCVPIHASELWISAADEHGGGIPNLHDSSYMISALTKPGPGYQDARASITALHAETSLPVVTIKGLVFKALPGTGGHGRLVGVHRPALALQWKPDPTLLNAAEAARVFGCPESEKDKDVSLAIKSMADCEALAVLYMRQFLESLRESEVDGMQWHHKHYVSWMRNVVATSAVQAAMGEMPELEARVAGTPEGKLVTVVGRNLSGMLLGATEPLDIIFGDRAAENVYRYSEGSRRCAAQLCSYLDALAHRNPKMKILEVGSGTGGTTGHVLDTLANVADGTRRFGHYDFTDISPSFFENAREAFKDHEENMSYRILNIDKDPAEQGFEAGSYDLVLAANVLHATSDMTRTLGNVRRLLKPGGKLLVLELTNTDVAFSAFCFGVLPGWWLSEDGREGGPLMPVESWRSMLGKVGFSGLDAVFSDFPDSEYRTSSTLVSTALPPASATEGTAAVDGSRKQQDSVFILVDVAPSVLQVHVADALSAALSTQGAVVRTTTMTGTKGLPVEGATCIALTELDSPALCGMSEGFFTALRGLTSRCGALVWLGRGGSGLVADPHHELVTGLARTVRGEGRAGGRGALQFVTVSFAESESRDTIAEKTLQILAQNKAAIAMDDAQPDNTFRVADGVVHVPRLVEATHLVRHLRAASAPASAAPAEEEDPSSLTEAEATALGRLAAWTALREMDAVRDGDVVLIHAAAASKSVTSATQAAVQLARHHGAEVFVAVEAAGAAWGAQGAKAYGLAADHVLSGDDESLGSVIRDCTGGRGANVVVQVSRSASEETRRMLLDCVATFGRFIDMAPTGDDEGGSSSSSYCCRQQTAAVVGRSNVRLDTVDVEALVSADAEGARAVLERAMAFFEGQPQQQQQQQRPASPTDGGAVPTTKASARVSEALGRLLRDATMTVATPTSTASHHDDDAAAADLKFKVDASYVIAGGAGGAGRSVARWMAARGAKHMILLSRSGAASAEARELVAELLREGGCEQAVAVACDVTDAAAVRRAVDECRPAMPPIRGCVQGAMVLNDSRFAGMSLAEWDATVRPRVDGSLNLVECLGGQLDFFVMLSSFVGLIGAPEQANYAAAVTFQDALARSLSAAVQSKTGGGGCVFASLDLPVLQDVGFVAEKPELMEQLRAAGWSYMEEDEFLATLELYCLVQPQQQQQQRSEDVVARAQVAPRLWLATETMDEGLQAPSWVRDPLFSHLRERSSSSSSSSGNKSSSSSNSNNNTKKDKEAAALLAATTSPAEAEAVVLEALLLKLSRVLSVELSNLDGARPLHAYGVDSLISVSLRAWLGRELGAELSVFEMSDRPSIDALAALVAERSKLVLKFA